MKAALQVLKKTFGHRAFRDGQEAVISRLLAGKSVLALLPTGGGKSLCYQIPALVLPGTALVISPLLALMRDQVDALRNRQVAAARLDSTQTEAEREAVLADFTAGKLKLLFLAPERLMQPGFQEILTSSSAAIRRLSLIAVDEAHCLSEWGHNFRPDYLRLGRLRGLFPDTPVLALTATALPEVAAEICRTFAIAPEDEVRTSFHRPNLKLRVTPAAAAKRTALLIRRLGTAGRQPAIVYVTRQETAEGVATALQRAGFAARAYHAGLPDDQRAEAQDDFLSGKCAVMVATVAFGMGIDLSGVRAVFHYDLPRSLENYLQETGRAGRDGRAAHCEMLASAEERAGLENFTLGDTPTPEAVRLCLGTFLRQGPACTFSRWRLSRSADVRPGVLDTLITHLELSGVLTPLSSTWLGCRVKLLRRASPRLLAGHAPREQGWLRFLILTREPVRGRIPIDVEEDAAALEADPEELREFLQSLETQGDLQLQIRDRRETWEVHPEADPRGPRDWERDMIALFQTHETAALARLQEVIDLFSSAGCLTKRLLARFGEILPEDCGHCERCLNPDKPPAPLPEAGVREITPEEAGRVHALIRTGLPALRHPRQLARFLCGLSSPAIWRDRLHRHDDYGLLAEVPFPEVLAQAEAGQG
ncbi:MAG: ATP-dependent DNA helicase RecQ [Verrucomicrobiota bacterium]